MKSKYIENEKLITLINNYVNEELYGDCSKLTYSGIGNYVRKNGYPKLQDKSIRDKEEIVNYVKNLKGSKNDALKAAKKLVIFKRFDINSLFNNNRSINDIKKILNQRDDYYKSISDNISILINEINKLEKENKEMKKRINELENDIKNFESIKQKYIAACIRDKQQSHIINNYINPEIANELLKEEGIIEKTKSNINESYLKDHLITSDTNISEIKSNVIKHLFSIVDEK